MKIIEIIRSLQRPFVIFSTIGTLCVLTCYLVIKYPSPEMARDAIIFLLGAGSVVTGFLFRDRVKMQNTDTMPK